MNHEIKSGFLGYTSTNHVENVRLPEPADLPVSEPAWRHRFLPAARLGAGVRLSERHQCRRELQFVVRQRHGQPDPRLTLNAGMRFDRYSSWLPAQGNPGTGPYSVREHLSGEPRLPRLQRLVAAPLADLRPDRQWPHRDQGELRPLRRVGLWRDRGERTGGRERQPRGHADQHLSLERHRFRTRRIPPICSRSPAAVPATRTLDPNLKPEGMDEFTGGVDLGFTRDLTCG